MKQCTYCKAENDDQATQCVGCGLSLAFAEEGTPAQPNQPTSLADASPNAQEATAQKPQPQPKPRKSTRTILIAAVAAVVAIAILLGVVLSQSAAQASKFMFPEITLWGATATSETECTLLADTDVVDTVDTYFPYSGVNSLDGSAQVLLNSESEAYVATKDGFSCLGDVYMLELANFGKGVAYTDSEGKLYLQTIPPKKEPLLLSEQANAIAISPDGETVAYVKEEADEYILYVYHEGEHKKIGSDLEPQAISDDGKYMYCTSIIGTGLYLADLSGNVTELATGVRSTFIFNQDNTQFIYCGDGDWYVVDHGEKIKIAGLMESTIVGLEAYMVIPTGACANGLESAKRITYGVETLAGNYYITNAYNTLSYVDENWESHEVSAQLYSMAAYGRISRDGNTICYAEGGTLYRVKDANPANKETLATDIYSFVITSDGEAVYYLDDSLTLWYREGGKEAVELADSVARIYITHDDYLLFLTGSYGEESDLYAVKDGSKPKLIADRVSHVYLTDSVSYYFQFTDEGDTVYDLYGTKKGTNFRFIAKD